MNKAYYSPPLLANNSCRAYKIMTFWGTLPCQKYCHAIRSKIQLSGKSLLFQLWSGILDSRALAFIECGR